MNVDFAQIYWMYTRHDIHMYCAHRLLLFFSFLLSGLACFVNLYQQGILTQKDTCMFIHKQKIKSLQKNDIYAKKCETSIRLG